MKNFPTKIMCLLLAAILPFSLSCAGKNTSESEKSAYKLELSIEEEARLKDVYKKYTPNLSEKLPSVSVRTSEKDQSYFSHKKTDVDDEWNYVDCTVSVTNCDDDYKKDRLEAQIKVRGNYTTVFEKKPFRIKFKKKTNLLGLNDGNEFKNWVLLAEYKDASFLRNATSLFLAKKILGTDGYYSSDYTYVSLYINGNYEGVYGLCEQQQTNKNRVDVYEPENDYGGTDIGYFFEMDGYYYKEDPLERFSMQYYGKFSGETNGITIKSNVYSEAQRDFLKDYLQKVYKIMYVAAIEDRFIELSDDKTSLVTSKSTNPYEVISQVVDLQSLVDMYLLEEIACDADEGWSSFFMSVDFSDGGDGKLKFIAPWDYDSAYGYHVNGLKTPDGAFNEKSKNPWIRVLSEEDWFMDTVRQKWALLKHFGVQKEAIEYIENVTNYYEKDFEKNYSVWKTLGSDCNGELINKVKSFTTQRDAANFLKDWLEKRFNHLDDVLLNG